MPCSEGCWTQLLDFATPTLQKNRRLGEGGARGIKKVCSLCLLLFGKRIKAFKSTVAKTGWQLLLSLMYQQWGFCSSVIRFVHFYVLWTDFIIHAKLTQHESLQQHQFRPIFQSLSSLFRSRDQNHIYSASVSITDSSHWKTKQWTS